MYIDGMGMWLAGCDGGNERQEMEDMIGLAGT